jgi:hypothetical protein
MLDPCIIVRSCTTPGGPQGILGANRVQKHESCTYKIAIFPGLIRPMGVNNRPTQIANSAKAATKSPPGGSAQGAKSLWVELAYQTQAYGPIGSL